MALQVPGSIAHQTAHGQSVYGRQTSGGLSRSRNTSSDEPRQKILKVTHVYSSAGSLKLAFWIY